MIVLLTDFGQSEYVGVVKAVIYSQAPQAGIVDLCHSVTPQSIVEASWILKCNYKYFPQGATFCCVVDPGVGTGRKAIAVQTDRYYFVGPDNGLLWETLREQKTRRIRKIPVPPSASATFHGRDVFAKAAAHIDLGRFDKIGRAINIIKKLELPRRGRKGIVVRIDSFGNIVTNLQSLGKTQYTVSTRAGKHTLNYYPNYSCAEQGRLFLIEGSNGTLEISLSNGSAARQMAVAPGQEIEIV